MLFDQCVRRVVVNRFEVLRFGDIMADSLVAVQAMRNVAYDIFDKFRIFVGALGDKFFIGALQ